MSGQAVEERRRTAPVHTCDDQMVLQLRRHRVLDGACERGCQRISDRVPVVPRLDARRPAAAKLAHSSSSTSRRSIDVARSTGSSRTRISFPSSRSSPSQPMVVLTTGTPRASASMIFRRVPPRIAAAPRTRGSARSTALDRGRTRRLRRGCAPGRGRLRKTPAAAGCCRQRQARPRGRRSAGGRLRQGERRRRRWRCSPCSRREASARRAARGAPVWHRDRLRSERGPLCRNDRLEVPLLLRRDGHNASRRARRICFVSANGPTWSAAAQARGVCVADAIAAIRRASALCESRTTRPQQLWDVSEHVKAGDDRPAPAVEPAAKRADGFSVREEVPPPAAKRCRGAAAPGA